MASRHATIVFTRPPRNPMSFAVPSAVRFVFFFGGEEIRNEMEEKGRYDIFGAAQLKNHGTVQNAIHRDDTS